MHKYISLGPSWSCAKHEVPSQGCITQRICWSSALIVRHTTFHPQHRRMVSFVDIDIKFPALRTSILGIATAEKKNSHVCAFINDPINETYSRFIMRFASKEANILEFEICCSNRVIEANVTFWRDSWSCNSAHTRPEILIKVAFEDPVPYIHCGSSLRSISSNVEWWIFENGVADFAKCSIYEIATFRGTEGGANTRRSDQLLAERRVMKNREIWIFISNDPCVKLKNKNASFTALFVSRKAIRTLIFLCTCRGRRPVKLRNTKIIRSFDPPFVVQDTFRSYSTRSV